MFSVSLVSRKKIQVHREHLQHEAHEFESSALVALNILRTDMEVLLLSGCEGTFYGIVLWHL